MSPIKPQSDESTSCSSGSNNGSSSDGCRSSPESIVRLPRDAREVANNPVAKVKTAQSAQVGTMSEIEPKSDDSTSCSSGSIHGSSSDGYRSSPESIVRLPRDAREVANNLVAKGKTAQSAQVGTVSPIKPKSDDSTSCSSGSINGSSSDGCRSSPELVARLPRDAREETNNPDGKCKTARRRRMMEDIAVFTAELRRVEEMVSSRLRGDRMELRALDSKAQDLGGSLSGLEGHGSEVRREPAPSWRNLSYSKLAAPRERLLDLDVFPRTARGRLQSANYYAEHLHAELRAGNLAPVQTQQVPLPLKLLSAVPPFTPRTKSPQKPVKSFVPARSGCPLESPRLFSDSSLPLFLPQASSRVWTHRACPPSPDEIPLAPAVGLIMNSPKCDQDSCNFALQLWLRA